MQKNAYALLGLAFLLVFGAAYILVEWAEAPSEDATSEVSERVEPAGTTSPTAEYY